MNSYRIHTHYLVIIIAKKKRELSFVTRSLSLSVFTLSLSLCVLVVVVVCFHFSPTKVGVRYKNKNSLPSSLSLVFGRKYTLIIGSNSYMLQLCNQRTPRVLHKGRDLFFCHHRRALSLLRPYEREREREKKKEREERAKTTPTKILYLQNTRNVEKKQVVATAFLPRLEREREIGSETRCIITQFSVILRLRFVDHHRLLKGDRF